MTRRDFLDLLDQTGTHLDEANTLITFDLKDWVDRVEDDGFIISDEEFGLAQDLLDRWDSIYTDFNLLYEAAQRHGS
jgi:hypothetical protein